MNISIGVTQKREGNSYNDLVTQLRNRVVKYNSVLLPGQVESINCYNNYVNRTTHI